MPALVRAVAEFPQMNALYDYENEVVQLGHHVAKSCSSLTRSARVAGLG
jgi:hypothetical protein